MSAASRTCNPLTLWDSPNAISSPASGAGPMPSASPDGPMTARSGRGVARVSPSAEQAREAVTLMRATSGLNSSVSSRSAALQSLLESRLRVALADTGSPLYALTWKHWAMPWGPPICARRASGHRTSASGSTGWATPTSRDHKDGASEGTVPENGLLGRQVWQAGWPTPTKGNADGSQSMESPTGKRADGSKATVSLNGIAKLTGWPTPNAGPQNDGDTTWKARREALKQKHGNGNGFGMTLGQASQLMTSGPMPSTSHAATGKPDRLNPAFSLWLMGYPTGWVSSGVLAMQLFPKSQRRSSKSA